MFFLILIYYYVYDAYLMTGAILLIKSLVDGDFITYRIPSLGEYLKCVIPLTFCPKDSSIYSKLSKYNSLISYVKYNNCFTNN